MDNPTNKPNDKKLVLSAQTKKIIIIAAVAIILILIIVLLIPKKSTNTTPGIGNEPAAEGQPNGEVVGEPGEITGTGTSTVIKDKYREEVPANIVIPDTNTQLTEAEKKEIALPTVVTPAAPGVEAQFRSFDIKGEGGVFTPNKIIARIGDTVHVNFTAVDKDYDIVFPSYNMNQTAKKGQTKILEFQALQEGSFTYYCSSCGGPESGPKGAFIIVNP